MRILICFISVIGIACSCQSNTRPEKLSTSPENKTSAGYTVYNKYCLSCHQSNGSGVPGMFPPLNKSERINSDKEYLIKVVLNGYSGEIEIDGEVFNGTMPSHSYLSDEQVAEVLNYVREKFGTNKELVTPQEVEKIRISLKDQD